MMTMESKYVVERTDCISGKVEYLMPSKKAWMPAGGFNRTFPRYGCWIWGVASDLSSGFVKENGGYGRFSYVCRPARGYDLTSKQNAALSHALASWELTQNEPFGRYIPGDHHHNTIESLVNRGYLQMLDRKGWPRIAKITPKATQGVHIMA